MTDQELKEAVALDTERKEQAKVIQYLNDTVQLALDMVSTQGGKMFLHRIKKDIEVNSKVDVNRVQTLIDNLCSDKE